MCERKNAKQLPKLLASQWKFTVSVALLLVPFFFCVPPYSSLSQPPPLFTCTSSSHQLLYFTINPLSSSSSYPASVASLISPQVLPPSQYFPFSASSPYPPLSSTRILLPCPPLSMPSEHCSVTAQLATACQETAPFVPRLKRTRSL